MVASPLLPRSPNIGSPNPRTKSISVRGSISKSAVAPPPAAKRASDADLAELLNEEASSRYVKGKRLGEGTFAVVYRGHLRNDPKTIVAIKKLKVQENFKDGLNVDSVREIKYLQELSHPNLISLIDVYSTKDQNINLVLEYFPCGTLEDVIRNKNVSYGAADVKAWMGMLCRGVFFCHENFVLHRDIKPNNLLIAADGEVKLADFGLARSFADPYHNMTHQVITLWYRPPELLYGARHYSGAVDVWSIGTVFAELLIRNPFVAGMTEIHQLELINQAIGTPTEDNWPGVSRLPSFVPTAADKIVPVRDKGYYESLFPTAGSHGVDLLMSMLKLDPRKRRTMLEVLQHDWWRTDPKPSPKENLPKQGGGAERMGEIGMKPGVVEDEKFKGVARKLDFGSMG
ncbi:putative serine threonine protein kinase [Phaeomoniella chlamydospora]|uniref:Putative serine threonine protein kinase n=1 Tax=Phaeomoniella chlamydospora TaxID=158046 RepID=A0A0G2F2K7_PHACM|nr:putative serine threonine protein kinase [Phaeomoniella chlamydospora]